MEARNKKHETILPGQPASRETQQLPTYVFRITYLKRGNAGNIPSDSRQRSLHPNESMPPFLRNGIHVFLVGAGGDGSPKKEIQGSLGLFDGPSNSDMLSCSIRIWLAVHF